MIDKKIFYDSYINMINLLGKIEKHKQGRGIFYTLAKMPE